VTGMAYASAGLRAGAQDHEEAAGQAGRVASVLASAVLPAGVLGQVTAAPGFAAAVEVVREAQGRAASAEATARADLAARARSAADQGDGLTATTTSLARAVVPGSIAAELAG
jgi:hypothetical protein